MGFRIVAGRAVKRLALTDRHALVMKLADDHDFGCGAYFWRLFPVLNLCRITAEKRR